MKHALLFALSCLLPVGLSAFSAQPVESLKLTQSIRLPGVQGRLGQLQFDGQRQRLYVAASDHNTVQVLDLSGGRVLHPLPISDPRDLLLLTKPNLLYVSSGKDGQLKVFDCGAERAIKTIGRLPDAGALRFDMPANRIYVANDTALTMVNAQTGVQTVSILLAGHPEAFAIEALGDRIFVNVPTANHVAVIERLSREVTAAWPLDGVVGNQAMALDEERGRLFIGCREPAQVVVLDSKSGKPVSDFAIAGDVGDVFYDAKRKWLLASCGEGFIDVFEQVNTDQFKPLTRLPTAKGARTSLYVKEGGLFFLAVPAQGGKPAEIRVYQSSP